MRQELLTMWEDIKKKVDMDAITDRMFPLMEEISHTNPTTKEYVELVKEYNKNSKIKNDNLEIEYAIEEIEFFETLLKEETDYNEKIEYENMIYTIEEDLEKKLSKWSLELMFDGEYDSNDVYLTIHAGSGGTEAQDWAQMLSRMYMRWADKNGFVADIVDSLDGETAGIKSMTLNIKGENIYGKLKGEHGVHRLVRVSPFDAKNRRHTSFSAVEVLPQLNDITDKIEINPSDITIQTFRSGGPGGQYQNTTDSGCRIIHNPTGIVVESRQKRSQMQNRRICEEMLAAKLIKLQEEEQQEAIDNLNEKTENGWGHAIRSYVFMPYQLVKDNRTGYETGKVEAVLDGEIDEFIKEYLLR